MSSSSSFRIIVVVLLVLSTQCSIVESITDFMNRNVTNTTTLPKQQQLQQQSSTAKIFERRFLQTTSVSRTSMNDMNNIDTGLKSLGNKNSNSNNNADYTALLEGTILLSANVEEYANLAYDVRDIRKKNVSSTVNYATMINQMKGIYLEGRNAEISSGRRFALKYLNDDLVNTLSKIGYTDNTLTTTEKAILPSSIVTPIYIYQLYGLSLKQRTTIDKVANYAYETIDKLFSLSEASTSTSYSISDVIADAILVQSFWMYGAHILYHGLGICREHVQADDVKQISSSKYGLNTFMALWIGSDQEIGNTNGYSLYAWTQHIASIFGTVDANNNEESAVNTQIKLLYYEGQQSLALPDACYSSKIENDYSYPSSTEVDLYLVLTRIIQQMMIPLFQYTIYYLLNDNITALSIYTKALIPQLVRCRPSTYERLYQNLMLSNQNYDTLVNEKQDILNDLIVMYTQCFRISCEEIGNYDNGNGGSHVCGDIYDSNNSSNNDTSSAGATGDITNAAITDDDSITKDNGNAVEPYPVFAGYTASSYVNDLSKIDLDIYQMKLLTMNQLYNYARYVYFIGCNVPVKRSNFFDPYQLISLYQLATSSVSTSTNNLATDHPYYSSYLAYYNNNEYMNQQILHALDPNYQFNSTSSSSRTSGVGSYMPYVTTAENRAELVHFTAAYFILFYHIMTLLDNTILSCNDDHENVLQGELDSITLYDLTNPLDEGVAMFIGSMEGTLIGGALDVIDEYLLYGLSEIRSFQFQTQNDIGYSVANSELLNEFYAAKALLSSLSCTNLQRTILHIQRLIQIGVFQSIIYVAVALTTTNYVNTPRNSGAAAPVYDSNLIIQGHVLSSIIVSSMNQYDPTMAHILYNNMMNSTSTTVIPDGAQKIADILGNYIYSSLGLSCTYLGTYSNINPCTTVKETNPGTDSSNNNYASSSISWYRLHYCLMVTTVVIGIGLSIIVW